MQVRIDGAGVRVRFEGNPEIMRCALERAGMTDDEFLRLYYLSRAEPWSRIGDIVSMHITGTNQPLFIACNPTFALYAANDAVVARWNHDGSVAVGNVRPLQPPPESVARLSEDWNTALVVAYADVVVSGIKEILERYSLAAMLQLE